MPGWTREIVAGHPCEVFEPAQRNEHNFCVIYLHGVHGGSLADHPPFIEEFERFGLRVMCPISGPSWWTNRIYSGFDTRVSSETYLIEKILPFIQSRFRCEPPAIALLGTSMGGQGALRLAYKYPDRFPVVAAISPAIDFQLKWQEGDDALLEMYEDPEEARQETAILHIHPLNWPRHQFFCCDPTDIRWYDSADRLRMKLYSLGVPHQCELETTAGGHGFPYYNAMAPMAIESLAYGLGKERLPIA